ncbi:MAG: DUF952 domain-containing protein [Alphaproteobacteria bacterium]|nr:DUF952 domain-containing protein [Alphaproteobacteria bacterium]
MPEEHTHPEYVYRLATAVEWAAAVETGAVPTRDIDERDEYFHLSTRAQALETARLYFADAEDLLALEIPLAEIADDTKFELAPKRGEAFPHLYGTLAAAQVSRVIRLVRTADGFAFGEAL